MQRFAFPALFMGRYRIVGQKEETNPTILHYVKEVLLKKAEITLCFGKVFDAVECYMRRVLKAVKCLER